MRHLPQAGLGGDYMDARAYGPARALLLVADVSGHGTPAAFGGIALKTWFGGLETGLTPVDILARADVMMGELFPGECYATAFCAIYDEHTGRLVYASAGHPPPVVISATAGCRSLDAHGGALGTADGACRELAATALAGDETLLAYTDGLSHDLGEIVARAGGARLGHRELALKEVLTGALDLATQADPLRAFGDDISLMALRPRAVDAGEEPALAGRRVLHIEDDATTVLIVGQALRDLGMLTSACASAAAAHPAILRERPDLVILDLVLPDRPGHALFREIRQRHPHLPVLIVSGNDLDHAARQCFDLNPAGILTKPVVVHELGRMAMTALSFDPDRDLVVFDRLGNEWFDFVISSSRTAVELLTRYLQALGRQPLPEAVLDDLVWCIREMAMNGIEWGNRFAPDLKVRISTLIMSDRVMVKIADEGSGFDAHHLFETFDPLTVSEHRHAQGKRCGGFGLAMVQALMTRVEFNQRGNVVLLVKEYAP
jgi:CheY-like chemotaxis protein